MDIGVIGAVAGGVGLALAAIALGLSWRLRRLWQKLSKQTKQESLTEILEKLLEHFRISQKTQTEIKRVLEEQGLAGQKHFQKVGIVRFNPFADSGGDQSFALALMDGHDRGFVISSLHSRQETRIYLKPVAAGSGKEFPLSKEEQQAIKIAK